MASLKASLKWAILNLLVEMTRLQTPSCCRGVPCKIDSCGFAPTHRNTKRFIEVGPLLASENTTRNNKSWNQGMYSAKFVSYQIYVINKMKWLSVCFLPEWLYVFIVYLSSSIVAVHIQYTMSHNDNNQNGFSISIVLGFNC